TIMSHAVAGAAIAQLLAPPAARIEYSLAAAVCAMLPDIDVVGFALGVRYGDMLGHRGITHSIAFAALAGAGAWVWRRDVRLAICLLVATLSHGILDAFTDGGLGVAFFAPFSSVRYFFPWNPIEVSPIGLGFLSERGLSVLFNEMLWIWTPSIALIGL